MPPKKQATENSDEEERAAIPIRTARRGKRQVFRDDDEDHIPDDNDEEEDIKPPPPKVQAVPNRKGRSSIPKDPKSQKKRPSGGNARSRTANTTGPSTSRASNAGIPVSQLEINRVEQLIARYKGEEFTARQSLGSMPTSQGVDAAVRRLTRHILFSHVDKPGIPIPRAELTKFVSNDPSASATANNILKKHGVAGYIIASTQARLIDNFGLEMVELVRQNRSGEGPKYFVIRSIVPQSLYASVIVQEKKDESAQGLLAVIVGIIQLAGGKISEDDLWRYLSSMGASKDTHHETFGTLPSSLLEEFVRKRQLIVDKENGPDGVENFYSIGEVLQSQVGDERMKAFYETELAEDIGAP